ncbi:hypothetical protein IG631_19796 [Alternaria alternata]|nr:hypothetical protein IG631_19796 [Alternaria alternata]
MLLLNLGSPCIKPTAAAWRTDPESRLLLPAFLVARCWFAILYHGQRSRGSYLLTRCCETGQATNVSLWRCAGDRRDLARGAVPIGPSDSDDKTLDDSSGST